MRLGSRGQRGAFQSHERNVPRYVCPLKRRDILGIRKDYPAEARCMGKNESCGQAGAGRYRRVQGSCRLQGWVVAGTRHKEESVVLWRVQRNNRFSAQHRAVRHARDCIQYTGIAWPGWVTPRN